MLSTSQREAVTHNQGPCLTLAGPGAGKTLVLTERIRYLLDEVGVNPEQILVITFTKAAAKEMQERFFAMIGESAPVCFGTFHSVFFMMLKKEKAYQNRKLLFGKEKIAVLKEVFANAKVEVTADDSYVQLEKEISLMKNTMTLPEDFVAKSFFEGDFLKLYEHYESRKSAYQYFDFDDLLTVTLDLLEHNEKFLHTWQNRFSYILIDEVQDMNNLQLEIIKLLALPENNVFLVGDEDQSIYGFRGANPMIMMQFSSWFPEGKCIPLTDNYRCRPEILTAANTLIAHNTSRFGKEIIPNRESGGSIEICGFDTVDEQLQGIATFLKSETNAAILSRGHLSLQMMAMVLEKHKIPFYMKERLPNILEKDVCADVMAYLRLTSDVLNRKDLYRVMNRPNRFLARASVAKEWTTFATWKSYYKEQSWLYDRIELLEKDLAFFKKLSGTGALLYLRKKIGYENYLREVSHSKEELDDKLAQYAMCEYIAKDAKNVAELLEKLEEAKWVLSKEQKADTKEGIALMTLHGSKGLEFDTVVIMDCNETVLPTKKAVTKELIEEERRLMFVGITRAKEKAILTYARTKEGEKISPSRFLKEIQGVKN